MILLSQLAAALAPWLADAGTAADCALSGAAADSREVRPGWAFCAIHGACQDGNAFIPQALQAGAAAIVSDAAEPPAAPVPVLRLHPGAGYHATARIAELFAGYPARKLKLYGITGTCGKSTTAYLLRDILRHAGIKTGMIGTVVYDLGGREIPADRTTPTPFLLQSLFSQMVSEGCNAAVIECSSAALDQERLGDAEFAGAVFTNFSRDHLDYHPTMEEYYRAKRKLFTQYLSAGAPAIINLDDDAGRRLAAELAAAGFPAQNLRGFSLAGGKAAPYPCRLDGRFNQYNATAAARLAETIGIPNEVIAQALAASTGAPGRLQRCNCPRGITAYVDYAHTPEELATVIATLRPLCRGTLAVLFGCGGDRDRGKRPMMGAAAAAADCVWLTSDNPRTEDPQAIIADTLRGLPPAARVFVEPDRAKAIRSAVSHLHSGDILLVAGKGHENCQEVQGRKIPFDDAEILRQIALEERA